MQPNNRRRQHTSSVWIVEDQARYGATVQQVVNSVEDLACPHVFQSGEAALEFMNGHFAPDAMFVDIGLPGMDGIQVVEKVSAISPATQLVMLTIQEDDDKIFGALCAGAMGYLLKSATLEEILGGLYEVLDGGAPMSPQIARRVLNLVAQQNAPRGDYKLTTRELQVLSELVEGLSKKQIATELDIAVHTVDTHIRNIYSKLHVHTRTQAVVRALRENLIPANGDG